MRLHKLAEAEHWYKESLRAKPDHIPAHLTYGKLLAMTVSSRRIVTWKIVIVLVLGKHKRSKLITGKVDLLA